MFWLFLLCCRPSSNHPGYDVTESSLLFQAALSTSRNDVFSSRNGARSGVDNIAIIISDGDSNVNNGNTIPEANQMRNQGIRVFSLATGDSPDMAEMNGIANDPDSEYVYRVRNSGEVDSVVGRLLDYLCQ